MKEEENIMASENSKHGPQADSGKRKARQAPFSGFWFMALMSFFVLSLFLLFVDTMGRSYGFAPPSRARNADPSPASGKLTQAEIAHLRYMREEEKLARDVYQVMANQWGIQIFGKIATSEQRHMDAILGILKRYGVPDPARDTAPGEFRDPHLLELYQALIQKGMISSSEALSVGGMIEEVDIADLDLAMADTTRQDLIRVYDNIQRGSRNHLRSFAKSLDLNGVAYKAQHLSDELVRAIIYSPMEKGGL